MSRSLRTGANSSTVCGLGRASLATAVVTLVLLLPRAGAQSGSNPPPAPASPPVANVESAPPGPGLVLYRKLSGVGIDPQQVYGIRDAALDREDVHITLDDGVIGFLESVDGRITGAFFEGEGEILVVPPDLAERGSLALFTGAAVLEERITSAYFRFNDDTAEQLRPALRPAEDAPGFVARWERPARALGQTDALRLMASFLNRQPPPPGDRMLRARVQGPHLGIFDVYFDTLWAEQIAILKFNSAGGLGYYDVLASFMMRSARGGPRRDSSDHSMVESAGTLSRLRIRDYKLRVRVEPPHLLDSVAQLNIDVGQGGDRLAFFELSRYLKVSQVLAGGQAVEFLQNEALEGSALARRGNDVVAVVFPEPLRAGQRLQLQFSCAGSVLSDAGGGLLYVGARGIWYPNRGMAMADYDLEFRYPANWTLVATGKLVSQSSAGEEQVARWVSERPIPVAGFNLGQYTVETAKAGNVLVEAYASAGVERTFRAAQPVVIAPLDRNRRAPLAITPPPPEPARHANAVAEISARAIIFFSRQFGPYPYSSLVLSQMPGPASQGWPGLIFLSSYAFLSPEERANLRLRPPDNLLYDQLMQIHETAHQWWGDLIGWKSYRDQWLVEALSNYSAILALEQDRPELCRALLEYYRAHLLDKNPGGEELAKAGAVTLGLRLSSSQFPDGFDAISYGRGTWLIHMLRHMLRDASRSRPGADQDEAFLRVLRKLRQRFEGREMSTRDLQQVLEEELPDSLRYEGRKSLDWFFRTWVSGTAVPRLELKNVKFARRGQAASVSFSILQKNAPNELITSVPVYASSGRGRVLLGRVFADGPESSFRLPVPAEARKLLLDPYGTVLTRP
jgi:hypothetical protein